MPATKRALRIVTVGGGECPLCSVRLWALGTVGHHRGKNRRETRGHHDARLHDDESHDDPFGRGRP